MAHGMKEMLCATILALYERIADAGLVSQVPRGVGKKSRKSVLALDGFDKGFRWKREDGFGRARRDHFVGVAGEHGKNLGAVCWSKVCAAGANRKFSFASGTAVPQILDNFGAESLHRVPTLNSCG